MSFQSCSEVGQWPHQECDLGWIESHDLSKCYHVNSVRFSADRGEDAVAADVIVVDRSSNDTDDDF